MTITNVTTATAAGTTSKTSSASTTATSSGTTDFHTFLNLLTTQLKNQDPLNPMDSTEFAVQLATFSGVEQQTQTNALLGNISGKMNLSNMSNLAGWVGRQGLAGMAVSYDGTAVTLVPETDASADSSRLIVKDATGKIVSSETIPPGATSFDWTGTDSEGTPLAAGTYSFSVENLKNGSVDSTGSVESYATIVEAKGGTDDTTLVFKGGIEVPASKVAALRSQ